MIWLDQVEGSEGEIAPGAHLRRIIVPDGLKKKKNPRTGKGECIRRIEKEGEKRESKQQRGGIIWTERGLSIPTEAPRKHVKEGLLKSAADKSPGTERSESVYQAPMKRKKKKRNGPSSIPNSNQRKKKRATY